MRIKKGAPPHKNTNAVYSYLWQTHACTGPDVRASKLRGEEIEQLFVSHVHSHICKSLISESFGKFRKFSEVFGNHSSLTRIVTSASYTSVVAVVATTVTR